MNGKRCVRVILLILLSAAWLGVLWQRASEEETRFNPLRMVRRPGGVQTRNDADLLSGWVAQVENGWEVGKNHRSVKSAFADVVANARKSTVRIFHKGRQVAMGTVVDERHVLTKASELPDHGTLLCRFWDQEERVGKRVGILPRHDLAMLRVEGLKLIPVQWFAGQAPVIGSLVATVSPGDSPLAIGVVSLASKAVESDGILGVKLRDTEDGVMVSEVIAESAAAQAGLLDNDLLVRVDQDSVSNSSQVVQSISRRLPGDRVQLQVRRGDQTHDFEAQLGRRADLDFENSEFQNFVGGQLSFRRSGFSSVLQHDTFMLPHHCGGPLVDLEGRVVGVNIARAERIASYALPASVILPWLDELRSGQTDTAVTRAGP